MGHSQNFRLLLRPRKPMVPLSLPDGDTMKQAETACSHAGSETNGPKAD